MQPHSGGKEIHKDALLYLEDTDENQTKASGTSVAGCQAANEKLPDCKNRVQM